MATWASAGPALRMHAVSWLSISGCGPLLSGGIHPSAITQRVLPSASLVVSIAIVLSMMIGCQAVAPSAAPGMVGRLQCDGRCPAVRPDGWHGDRHSRSVRSAYDS